MKKIIDIYNRCYEQKLPPEIKNFLYSDDAEISRIVISIIEFPYDISPGWMKNYEMPVPTREDNYKKEIISTLSYLELKKIKKVRLTLAQTDWELLVPSVFTNLALLTLIVL